MERNDEHKKQIANRLSRIMGQLQEVKRMTEEKRECGETLIQMSAARLALESVSKLILQNHVNCCIQNAIEKNDNNAVNDLNNILGKFLY